MKFHFSEQGVKLLSALFICFFLFAFQRTEENTFGLKERVLFESGDIIFQVSRSSQSKAIQAATGSRYSHVGMIFRKGKELSVLEAVQPVKIVPLHQWISKGVNSHYVVKRLKNADEHLTKKAFSRMDDMIERFLGRDYDPHFEWTDEKMYCSELVWKLYKGSTGLEIGKLQELQEFNLQHKDVKRILRQRYKDSIPLEEPVISPVAMYNSKLLETIVSK